MENRQKFAAAVTSVIIAVVVGTGVLWHSRVEAQTQADAVRAAAARDAQSRAAAAAARDLAQEQAALAQSQANLARLEAQGRAKREWEARAAEKPQVEEERVTLRAPDTHQTAYDTTDQVLRPAQSTSGLWIDPDTGQPVIDPETGRPLTKADEEASEQSQRNADLQATVNQLRGGQ